MEQTTFSMTVIAGKPRLEARILSCLLASLAELLAESARLQQDTGVEWGISGLLAGFSETSDNQRLAIELTADGTCEATLGCVFSRLEELRSYKYLDADSSSPFLLAVRELSKPVAEGEIQELWLSQTGETPVFVTSDTYEHASDLIGRRTASSL